MQQTEVSADVPNEKSKRTKPEEGAKQERPESDVGGTWRRAVVSILT